MKKIIVSSAWMKTEPSRAIGHRRLFKDATWLYNETLYIIILALFIVAFSNAQTGSTDNIDTYDYDTTLKGGYTISFKVDERQLTISLS